tara:strand:+ start:7984 stop:9870 length:1887 start_codon:yes stop_codon:yes gene_type:complete
MGKPHDLKPDFGEERSIVQFDRDQIFTDIARVTDEAFEPKGVLEANTKIKAIVIKKDEGPNPAEPKNPPSKDKDSYHIYVQSVHYNKVIPLALKNADILRDFAKTVRNFKGSSKRRMQNTPGLYYLSFLGSAYDWTKNKLGYKTGKPAKIPSDLKKNPVDRAFEVYVASDFNDGTSYMTNATGETLRSQQIVNIKYDSVVGGVPSGGKIVEILYGEDGKPLMADVGLIKSLANGGYFALGDTPFTLNASDLKLGTIADAVSDQTIQKKAAASPCKNIVIDKYFGDFNFNGKRFYFDFACKDFQNVLVNYKQNVKKSFGKGANLLSNGLGNHFKEVLRKNIPTRPYFFGGTGEYTPKWAYSYQKNVEKIPKAKVGKKSYKEFYKKFITKDGILKESYDCSGIGSYLAFHSGFLLGVKNFAAQKDKFARTASQQYENIRHLQISIQQFAHTPGALCITNKGSHALYSAGEGFTIDKDGDFKVNVYEASYFNRAGTKRAAFFVKESDGGFYRRGFGGTPTATFGIPPSFIYADQRNMWTSPFVKPGSIREVVLRNPSKPTGKGIVMLISWIRKEFKDYKIEDARKFWSKGTGWGWQYVLEYISNNNLGSAGRKAAYEEVREQFKKLQIKIK